jgi:UDP-glucose 4-epimerase
VLGAGDGAGGAVAGGGSGAALETVCLRYFNVYGPRQDPSSQYSGAIARFLTSVAEGRPLEVFGDGRQTRDFVYVGDVVAANLLALTTPGCAGTVINVGSGRETSVLDLVQAALGLAGRSLAVTHGAARPGDVRRSSASLHRAAELLGYAPAVDLSDGLRRTYEWYARPSAAGGASTANGDGQPA